MLNYLIEVSRQTELTSAELQAILPNVAFGQLKHGWLHIQTAKQLDQAWLDRCGSIQSVWELKEQTNNISEFAELIAPLISNNKFAINCYPGQLFKKQNKLLTDVKKAAKQQIDGKLRYLNKGRKNVHTAYLLEQGWQAGQIDLIGIIQWGSDYLICQARGIQDINAYTDRDYNKPARNMDRGMLPPKLAQILINLACGTNQAQTIYDPFCGSGTILLEALLNGHQAVGSDIDPLAISESATNLEWGIKQFNLNSQTPKLFTADATNLANLDFNFDLIVSEGFLGPIRPNPIDPSDNQIQTDLEQISQIYQGFFKSITPQLQSGQKIIITIPVFRTKAGSLHFLKKTVEIIEQLGYSRSALQNAQAVQQLGLPKPTTDSIVYIRPNQVVGRQIMAFTKQ